MFSMPSRMDTQERHCRCSRHRPTSMTSVIRKCRLKDQKSPHVHHPVVQKGRKRDRTMRVGHRYGVSQVSDRRRQGTNMIGKT